MSDQSALDLEQALSRLRREREESDKLRAETLKLTVEQAKLGLEQFKLIAETLEYDRDRKLVPVSLVLSAMAALGAAATALIAVLRHS